jgi:hypothetical protein
MGNISAQAQVMVKLSRINKRNLIVRIALLLCRNYVRMGPKPAPRGLMTGSGVSMVLVNSPGSVVTEIVNQQ